MQSDSRQAEQSKIIMYSTDWCPDCWRAKKVFEAMGVAYHEVKLSHKNPDAVAIVERINRGNHSVPTIVFPDGSTLTEPRTAELSAKLSAMM